MFKKITSSIDQWHSEVFIQNRYTRAYRKLIEWAKSQNRTKKSSEYVEHHIVPKCFYRNFCDDGWLEGNYDAEENRVLLTHREHAWCHILLALRMTDGLAKAKMNYPLKRLLKNPARGIIRLHHISSALLSTIMKNAADSASIGSKKLWDDPDSEFYSKFCLTMKEIANRPEVQAAKRVVKGGWLDRQDLIERHCLIMKEIANRPETRRKKKIGAKIAANRDEVKEKKTATRKARYPTPESREHLYDNTVYTFVHRDGRIYVGPRWRLELQENLRNSALKGLLAKNPRHKTLHGWRLSLAEENSK